jgi:hypothetical protein
MRWGKVVVERGPEQFWAMRMCRKRSRWKLAVEGGGKGESEVKVRKEKWGEKNKVRGSTSQTTLAWDLAGGVSQSKWKLSGAREWPPMQRAVPFLLRAVQAAPRSLHHLQLSAHPWNRNPALYSPQAEAIGLNF